MVTLANAIINTIIAWLVADFNHSLGIKIFSSEWWFVMLVMVGAMIAIDFVICVIADRR